MKPAAKVTLILVGYVLAILVAFAVVSIYVAATSGPERPASSGMYAFGDSLLFLAVFGFAAIPATSVMLFFLRGVQRFWPVLSVTALAIAASGVAAVCIYFAQTAISAHSMFQAWATFSPIRVLMAPLFALAFLLSGVFAPTRSSRIALLLATTVEIAVFVSVASQWFDVFGAH